MYRVALRILLTATVGLGLGACSLNTGGISSGFNDLGTTASIDPMSGSRESTSTGSIDRTPSASTAAKGTQVAAFTR